MTRRHGRTPIEWLSDIGFLSSRTIIGHGIFTTGSGDVRTVLVDDVPVVDEGQTLTGNQAETLAAVQAAAQRVWDNWQKHDWANRTVEEHFPLSYPEFVTGAGG